MKNNKIFLALTGAGILAAVAASICCIAPVLALVAGATGIAASLSWLAPARPYLVSITIAVLGYAWFKRLKPDSKKGPDCAGENEGKPSFIKSKAFLAIITLFSLLVLAFPLYSRMFYPRPVGKLPAISGKAVPMYSQAILRISGMDCAACEGEVNSRLSQLPGYMGSTVDYRTGKATVNFESSGTSLKQVIATVNATGYRVISGREK